MQRLEPPAGGALRIEVTDARGDRAPHVPDPVAGDAEADRGLRIVTAPAERRGVEEAPARARTAWAEPAPGRGTA
ncbi:hypothetical protein SUDANB6_03409 [Streptomyces sp. enrichment culture]|uniref:hypothetical protein n=1 Tax=Streptomyces sp. enrichment culture TaxID=1795815 RepID=UPI003F571926